MKNKGNLISDRKYLSGTAAFCIAIFLLIISLSEALIQKDYEHETSLVRDSMLNTGAILAQDIQQKIIEGIFVTETLEVLLTSNNFSVARFENWGKQIVGYDSAATTVQLAPEGIVSHIYPLAGNEGALGHDLLKDKSRDDGARKAVNSKETTFIGPVKLIQNQKYAVIARKPIFIKKSGREQFWGFTIALLLVEDILPTFIKDMEKQGTFIHLEGHDPDAEVPPVFYESPHWNDKDTVSINIKVPNGNWVLKLSHVEINNALYATIRAASYSAAILLLIFIFIQQYKMRRRQRLIFQLNQELSSDIEQRKKAEEEKELLIGELKEALDNVKVLSGLVPICARCKKIRDDEGYWNNLETFLENHSDILFSHGMCQECSDELYGDQKWYKKMKKKNSK